MHNIKYFVKYFVGDSMNSFPNLAFEQHHGQGLADKFNASERLWETLLLRHLLRAGMHVPISSA